MATLKDIFPGNTGRMKIQRVMALLGLPQLGTMNPDEPLDPLLESRLRAALREGADDTN